MKNELNDWREANTRLQAALVASRAALAEHLKELGEKSSRICDLQSEVTKLTNQSRRLIELVDGGNRSLRQQDEWLEHEKAKLEYSVEQNQKAHERAEGLKRECLQKGEVNARLHLKMGEANQKVRDKEAEIKRLSDEMDCLVRLNGAIGVECRAAVANQNEIHSQYADVARDMSAIHLAVNGQGGQAWAKASCRLALVDAVRKVVEERDTLKAATAELNALDAMVKGQILGGTGKPVFDTGACAFGTNPAVHPMLHGKTATMSVVDDVQSIAAGWKRGPWPSMDDHDDNVAEFDEQGVEAVLTPAEALAVVVRWCDRDASVDSLEDLLERFEEVSR